MKIFQERVKVARNNKGLTQRKVAEEVGIKRTTYTSYEQNVSNPDLETLVKIADKLDVSTDYLLGREDIPLKDSNKLTDDEIIRLKELVETLKINNFEKNNRAKLIIEKAKEDVRVELENISKQGKYISIADVIGLIMDEK